MSKAFCDTDPAYDAHGKITFMVRSGGYVMCRRPRLAPFVLSEKDWRKLPKEPLPEGAQYPAVMGGGVHTADPLARLRRRAPTTEGQ